MTALSVLLRSHPNSSSAARTKGGSAPNNGMHPTRDTAALIILQVAGGRVMPGVRRLLLLRVSV